LRFRWLIEIGRLKNLHAWRVTRKEFPQGGRQKKPIAVTDFFGALCCICGKIQRGSLKDELNSEFQKIGIFGGCRMSWSMPNDSLLIQQREHKTGITI